MQVRLARSASTSNNNINGFPDKVLFFLSCFNYRYLKWIVFILIFSLSIRIYII